MLVFKFFYHSQPLFEIVSFQLLVCESTAYAIFAEPRFPYPQLPYYLQCRRWHVSVALELYYGYVLKAVAPIAFQVVETQVEVDGQPLGLLHIYQCYAVEPVFYYGGDFLQFVPGIFGKEWNNPFALGMQRFQTIYEYALFLCAPVVVLVLYLEEGVVGVKVGAHAYFLPHLLAAMVHTIHFVILGIEICGVVAGKSFVIFYLYVVFALHSKQEVV